MKTITLTDEQYQALTNGETIIIQPPKPKITKWQPKGGKWIIRSDGYVGILSSLKDYREFGTEYQTKEQAEWARDKMRSFNRQLAWLAENDDGGREDWNDIKQKKWFIYYDHRKKSYGASYETENQDLNKIYMSEYNVKILAEALNFWEVVL